MATTKTWLGAHDRYARLRKIKTLDPEKDSREITKLFYEDFMTISIFSAIGGFLLGDAAPSMSRLLSSTGELEKRVAKRFVDTALLGRTVLEHGVKSAGPGRDAARRVNTMHRSYDINPDDFVAFGIGQVLFAIDVAEKLGWREVTDIEREALRVYYTHETRIFGGRVPLPPTLKEMRAFWEKYLDEQLAFEPQNLRMANLLLDFVKTLLPVSLRPIMTPIVLAQIDPRIVKACGLQSPGALTRWTSTALLRLIAKRDPLPDNTPDGFDVLIKQVYPDGFAVQGLGTHTRVKPEEDSFFTDI
jgi:ER-bound oxygenase mpaB/B'/Rubber oxygenase, catalytic domain